jgi:hypothetical protein
MLTTTIKAATITLYAALKLWITKQASAHHLIGILRGNQNLLLSNSGFSVNYVLSSWTMVRVDYAMLNMRT